MKRRNSQDFPAAGLRWTTAFPAGKVSLRAVGKRGGKTVTDEISFDYETRQWGTPARFELKELSRNGKDVTVEALLVDASGVPCLDSRKVVRFSVAGEAADARQPGNGRRLTRGAAGERPRVDDVSGYIQRRKASASQAVNADGVPPAFLTLKS